MLLALATAIGSVSACNVIVNPGFEAGLSGWQFTQPGAVSPTGAVVHSGAGALAFTMPNLAGTSIAYQTLPVAGDPASLSFWIRVDQLAAAKIRVDVSIGAGPFLTVPVVAADEWTLVDLSAQVAPFPLARELRFYAWAVGTGHAGAKVYLDDVNFGVVPSPGVMVLAGMMGVVGVRRRG